MPTESTPSLCPVSQQSKIEELANSLTHGVGLAGSIVGLIILLVLSIMDGSGWLIFSSSVYGTSLVLLYGASTWYHACRCERRKRILRVADHACIYLLIAGSYTPFTLGPLSGPWGWSLFGIVWTIAVLGIVLKILTMKIPDWLSAVIYLGMGWMAVIAIKPLMEALSLGAMLWITAGGLAYSIGVIFYLWERLPFSHAIWHVFVLTGSVCHYVCVTVYVVGA